MPVADFPGRRNWGYDGVLPFAPDASYGTPEDLKRLVAAAHARGLMVLLDVVYNHFGPEGNYLHAYAPQFFTAAPSRRRGARRSTSTASAAAPCATSSSTTRSTGSRSSTSTACASTPCTRSPTTPSRDILAELGAAVRDGPGRERHVHLVLENDRNEARYLARAGGARSCDAQWNDDVHHALHVLLDRRDATATTPTTPTPARRCSARCLAEGFAYQGEPSALPRRRAARRAERARCRRPPSSTSCRTTTRSATAPSASASAALAPSRRARGGDRLPAPRPARRRCSSWARSSARRRRSCSSATSAPSSPPRSPTAGAREFARFDALRRARGAGAHPRSQRPGDLRPHEAGLGKPR